MDGYSRRFFTILLALFCAPLIAHIYLGSYSRFLADDFCSSAVARSQGIFRGALHWYLNWNGRFSANLLDSFFGYIGPGATPYATGLAIIFWFIVLSFTVVQLLPEDDEREVRPLLGGVIAAMILFAVLKVIPFVGQSLYWGQGMRSVVPPLILGTAYIALVAKTRINVAWLIVAALLTFVASGFAETYFALQTSAIIFALIIYRRQRDRLWLLVAGLAGSLAGGLIMFFAPGNNFRQSAFPPPPAPPELLEISFRGMSEFFALVVLSPEHRFIWAGLVVCGFIFGAGMFERSAGTSRSHVWALISLPFVTLILLLACWVPMAYGTSLILAYRTFIIPAYVLVCLLFCWSYIAGRLCGTFLTNRTRLPATVLSLIGLLAFGLIAAKDAREIWKQRSIFAGYARNWDEREQMIQLARSQGMPYAVVRRLHNWAALDEVAVDPKITWLTKCVQDYYGIGVIPDLGDLYGEPDGEARQADLVRQFDNIPQLPGAVPTELNQIYKTDRGKIGFYKTTLAADQIKSHYETELAKLGWKYKGEKKVEAFQRFSGGGQHLFCNGDTAATLFIAGKDEERIGYTYSLALNWGMSSGFTWGVVDCRQ